MRKRPVVATVMKMEAPGIVEWVAWYQLHGFDLMIADNCVEGQQTALLRSLEEAGHIIYIDARHLRSRPQMPALDMLFTRARALGYRILGFLDADEFLEPLDHDAFAGAQLVEDLFARPLVWGISFRWAVFGSSGRTAAGEGLVLERFKNRGPSDAPSNRYVKSFVSVRMLWICNFWRRSRMFTSPHIFKVPRLFHLLDGSRGKKQELTTPNGDWRLARIRHYAVKSAEEFQRKSARGDPFNPENDFKQGYLAALDLNDLPDPLSDRTIDAVSQRVREIERSLRIKSTPAR